MTYEIEQVKIEYKEIPTPWDGLFSFIPTGHVRAPKPKKKFSLSNGETSIYYNNAILFPADFVQ